MKNEILSTESHASLFRHMKLRRSASVLAIIICLLAFIPIAAISRYDHPATDDYNYSQIAVEAAIDSGGGFFDILVAAAETTKHYYTAWDGKYTASFIFSLHPGSFTDDERFYALTPAIIILSLILCLYYFLYNLFLFFEWDTSFSFTLSLLAVLTAVEGMPRPFEGIFWFCGGMAYVFFFAVFLIQCGLLLNIAISHRQNKHTIVTTVLTVINAFFLAGGNNISAFIIVPINLLFIIYSVYFKKYRLSVCYTVTCISSFAGFLIVFLAPATDKRSSGFNHPGLIKSILVSFINTGFDVINSINFPLMLLLLLAALFIYPNIRTDGSIPFKWTHELLLVLFSVCLFAGSVFVPYYVMGNVGPARAYNLRFCLFIVLALVNAIYILGIIKKYAGNHKCISDTISLAFNGISPKPVYYSIVVISVLCITLFSNRISTSYKCMEELLSGEAKAYHMERLEGVADTETVNKPEMLAY